MRGRGIADSWRQWKTLHTHTPLNMTSIAALLSQSCNTRAGRIGNTWEQRTIVHPCDTLKHMEPERATINQNKHTFHFLSLSLSLSLSLFQWDDSLPAPWDKRSRLCWRCTSGERLIVLLALSVKGKEYHWTNTSTHLDIHTNTHTTQTHAHTSS